MADECLNREALSASRHEHHTPDTFISVAICPHLGFSCVTQNLIGAVQGVLHGYVAGLPAACHKAVSLFMRSEIHYHDTFLTSNLPLV